MSTFWTDTASFIDALITDKGVIYVTTNYDELIKDEVPFTEISRQFPDKTNVWENYGEVRWDAAAICFSTNPERDLITISVTGLAYISKPDSPYQEVIASASAQASSIGLIRSARTISGKTYACGMRGQVWKREGRDHWVFMTEELPRKNGFESLDGFNENEIYAAGWEGEIWQFDGERWTQHDSGTNVILVDIICAGDGQVYAVGRGGMLVRGRGAAWEAIKLDIPVDLWSLAWFKGELYACSTRDIFKWNGETFLPMQIEGDRPKTLQYLNVSTHGEELCVVGPKDLFRFDGTTWTRID